MDAIVVVLLIGGILTGIRKGLSGEIAMLVATLASGLAAWKLSGWAGGLFARNTSMSGAEAGALGVLVVFLGVYVGLYFLRKALAAMMQFNFKGKAERIGGALCGLIRMVALALVLLLMATFIPNEKAQSAVNNGSFCGRFVNEHIRPICEDLARKNKIPLPGTNSILTPPKSDDTTPPVRDVEITPPPDGIGNEVPAGEPLGPAK